MLNERPSAYKQLTELNRQINSLVADSSRKEQECRSVMTHALTKPDNKRNYALSRIEKEDQLRILALKRSMPKHYVHLGACRKVPEFKESKLGKKLKKETSVDNCLFQDRSRNSNSLGKKKIEHCSSRNGSQERKMNKIKQRQTAIDGLHSILARKYSSNFKLTFNEGNKIAIDSVEGQASPGKAARSTSVEKSTDKLKKLHDTEKSRKLSGTHEKPQTAREPQPVFDSSPKKSKKYLQPAGMFSSSSSTVNLIDHRLTDKGHFERYISQRRLDMDVQTNKKLQHIQCFEKHRLMSLYQQKAKIMRGSCIISEPQRDIRRSSSKIVDENNTNRELNNSGKTKPQSSENRVLSKTATELKLIEKKPSSRKGGDFSNLEGCRNPSQNKTKQNSSSRSPAKIGTMSNMIDYLGKDKELSSQRSVLRQHFLQLHKDFSGQGFKETASQIDHENLRFYKTLSVLGDGSSSIVHLVADLRDGKKYAMKVLSKPESGKPRIIGMTAEDELLRGCDHPNVIKLIDRFESKSKLYMVLEYIGSVSLAQHLESKKLKKSQIGEDEGAHIFYEISQGLSYLHRKGIYHRDLKLHNILVGLQGEVKIIDLGYAVELEKEVKVDTFCGTPTYLPPEIVSRKTYLPSKADIWSLGVCLYRVLCGRFPFMGVSQTNLFYRIKMSEYSLPEHLSSDARHLISSMLSVDPESRPSIDDVLQHAWFKGVNFESTAAI